jgi:hypothetical protein
MIEAAAILSDVIGHWPDFSLFFFFWRPTPWLDSENYN